MIVSDKVYNLILVSYKKALVLFTTLILFYMSLILNIPAQFTLLLVGFFTFNSFYQDNFHTNSGLVCIGISVGVFSIALCVIHTLNIFAMTAPLLAIVITYGSSKLKVFVDKYNNLKCSPFNIKTCTEIELLERCRLRGLNKYQTEQAVKHFVLKMEHKEINYLCPEASRVERTRLKKMLT